MRLPDNSNLPVTFLWQTLSKNRAKTWRILILFILGCCQMRHRFYHRQMYSSFPSATELRGGLSGSSLLAQGGLSVSTLHRIPPGQFWNISSEFWNISTTFLVNLFLCLVTGQKSSSQILWFCDTELCCVLELTCVPVQAPRWGCQHHLLLL